MRVLILGAGGIGGYFGARIHRAGGDVTFLVKSARANFLVANGLQVFSPHGDIHFTPKVVTSTQHSTSGKFDVVILTCKAYDLDSAIDSIKPFLDSKGVIIPLLNGFTHLARLDAEFTQERVLGGLAHLSVTLAPGGEIWHFNDLHRLVIGSRAKPAHPLIATFSDLLADSGIDFSLSENIEWEMWEKFIYLSVLAGATCTMRTSIGNILQTHDGEKFIQGLLEESIMIAKKYGHVSNPELFKGYRNLLTMHDSSSKASMLRDIELKRRTEADHIIGDLIRRGELMGVDTPKLKIAYFHLQAYETRLNREHT